MSTLFVNNIKHTNTQDAISIDTGGNVALNQVGTGVFYRTGTFTPFLGSSATNPAYTQGILTNGSYVHRVGHYTRIGDMVYAYVDIKFDYSGWTYQNGGANANTISIGGFPFKTANITEYYPPTQHCYYDLDAAMNWTQYNLLGMPNVGNIDYVRIVYPAAGGTTAYLVASHFYYQASGSGYDSRIIFNWNYRTDEA